MPYFKNNKINLLFIHIPKTGGSSLEKYFNVKFNIPLNKNSLMSTEDIREFSDKHEINSSLQHLTYNTIIKYKDFFKIDETNIKIITIVRNPYDKLMSDLFYLKKINISSTKEEVYEKIKIYLQENYDNHITPQYKFITNDNENLIDDIMILHTETLNDDMLKLGYKDFNIKMNMNPNVVNYQDYLNEDSIKLINEIYKKDFEILNYNKK
jgi:hypothetical protein